MLVGARLESTSPAVHARAGPPPKPSRFAFLRRRLVMYLVARPLPVSQSPVRLRWPIEAKTQLLNSFGQNSGTRSTAGYSPRFHETARV